MKELRALGATGLHCHPLGFGCYRIAAGHAGHEAALRAYLARGGNLIDTSANYGDGASRLFPLVHIFEGSSHQ
jgi:aryl-alcohol dehydrogenase-like predicted oxidoreductase